MQQNTEATVEFLKAIAGFGLFILGISAIQTQEIYIYGSPISFWHQGDNFAEAFRSLNIFRVRGIGELRKAIG